VADALLTLSQRHNIAGAAVDAWQTLAVVRQTRGEVGAALEARRSAARAASAAGLKAREAMLTINVGFALTTVGARGEARLAIESGIALAEAIGSPGVERHGKMILLCWAATFGSDPSLDATLADTRGLADAALAGSWVPHDRATLGVLFYRGMERLRAQGGEHDARTLLRIAAQGYRQTKMLDVLPVALGSGRRPSDAAATEARPAFLRTKPRRCSTKARRASSTRRRCSSRSTTHVSISASWRRREARSRGGYRAS